MLLDVLTCTGIGPGAVVAYELLRGLVVRAVARHDRRTTMLIGWDEAKATCKAGMAVLGARRLARLRRGARRVAPAVRVRRYFAKLHRTVLPRRWGVSP